MHDVPISALPPCLLARRSGDRRGRAGGGGACGVRRGAHRTIGRAPDLALRSRVHADEPETDAPVLPYFPRGFPGPDGWPRERCLAAAPFPWTRERCVAAALFRRAGRRISSGSVMDALPGLADGGRRGGAWVLRESKPRVRVGRSASSSGKSGHSSTCDSRRAEIGCACEH